MKAYGVPWGVQLLTHPLHKLIAVQGQTRGMGEICWDTVWKNLYLNPDHQLIHFKCIHRMYLTPRKRHAMKLIPSPYYHLCTLNVSGSFLHMFWECPNVFAFWRHLCLTFSDMLGVNIPLSLTLLLLNDDYTLELSLQQKRILWTGLTAAKKTLVLNRKYDQMQWKHTYQTNYDGHDT
uniref:Reverse transcriptase zinc-binding domain-containing protein n=1 Tax=Sander lucioperca TaxID=283035 RepID=A0A8C9ZF71_SANLU